MNDEIMVVNCSPQSFLQCVDRCIVGLLLVLDGFLVTLDAVVQARVFALASLFVLPVTVCFLVVAVLRTGTEQIKEYYSCVLLSFVRLWLSEMFLYWLHVQKSFSVTVEGGVL